MPRDVYHERLRELEQEMMVMGNLVDRAIEKSMEALKTRDSELANRVIQEDLEINRKRFDIEGKCLKLIATQQPMAVDLRTIASILNVITDLERMGDHAEGIAKITVQMGGELPIKPLIDLPIMAQKTREMLNRSLSAFIHRDVEEAKRICEMDDEIDALYDLTYEELVNIMVKDPNTITRATHLLWAAHNLERTADRVTNICERVVFLVTGKMEEKINVSKY